MPAYNKSPFADIPRKLIPGQPVYLLGSWPKTIAPTRFQVSAVAATSSTAAVYTVTINEGNIPVVGALLTVKGTATQSGAFNVTNAVISAVSITASTGQGTITVTTTGLTTVGTTADGGNGIVPQPEVPETLVAQASIAVGLPYTSPFTTESNIEAIQFEVSTPTTPTAVTVTPQGAMVNLDANYVAIGPAILVVAGSTPTYGPLQVTGKYNFIRVLVSGLSGTGTILCKVGI